MAVDIAAGAERRSHLVYFYDTSAELYATAGADLQVATEARHSIIVIATPEHVAGLSARADVTVALDAAQTLASLMVDGRPSAARFDAVVGDLVRQHVARGPVTAYGEMVGLLWQAGQVNAAIELEELWNALGAEVPFALVCAYPRAAAADADTHTRICGAHSDVGGQRWFAPVTASPRAARDFVAAQLRSWGLHALVEDARLAVTELATNAIRHARTDFSVSLTRIPGGVRLIVSDGSTTAPVLQEPVDSAWGGRGLYLTSRLATDWGHRPSAAGKCVWVDLL